MDGSELKRLREERQMTQRQLAEALGVGWRTVSNWEREATLPKSRAGAIVKFFGLNGSADPIRAVSDVDLLIELTRRARDRERRSNAG